MLSRTPFLYTVPLCGPNEEFFPQGSVEVSCMLESYMSFNPGCYCNVSYYRSGSECVLMDNCGCSFMMGDKLVYKKVRL